MKTVIGFLVAICLICMSNAYHVKPPKLQPVVCPCQYKYDPVCGSDGVTYMNKCVLNCTSYLNVKNGLTPIDVVEDCECRGNCNCQPVDLPVCTLDGLNYPNECELACENIKRIANKQTIIYLAYRTACLGPPGPCTDIAAPVCGTDNILYRNKCVLNYASYDSEQQGLGAIKVKNNGACQDGCLCPLTSQPVCGSDGNFYNNPCKLECENEKRKCNERPPINEVDKVVCEGCFCTAQYEPVCASDGNTYSNPCQLGCEIKKQQNPDLKALYSGECVKCKCNNVYSPVCGTDRKTYKNSCWMECENIDRSKDLSPIGVFHEGECQSFACDCTYCDEAHQPVCGSDDQTYWNLCWLKCNDKCKQKVGGAVYLAKRGPC